MRLLVVQPWFSAIGHPAQSLLSFASALGRDERAEYLVSWDRNENLWGGALSRLKTYGKVATFNVSSSTGAANTVKALFSAWRLQVSRRFDRLFFFDGSLFILALWWPLFSLILPVERLGVLYLFAPNFGRQRRLKLWIMGRFLQRAEVRLYLRTEELAAAWRQTFPDVASDQIRYLPSLEIDDDLSPIKPSSPSEILRFGIIGQIRIGKSIEWLVPAFNKNKTLGLLTVAGEFNLPQTRTQLPMLEEFEGLINRYLSESEMLELAGQQHYLLMLYDIWDRRMESAVMYLAARVNRPVIVYGDSWCGRKVLEYGCGVVAPESREKALDLLCELPKPGSVQYAMLLKGMEAFRAAHSTHTLRGQVISELLE